MPALIASVVLLTLISLGNIVITLAMIRRLRTLEESGTAGAPKAQLPGIGSTIDLPTVTTTAGEVVAAEDLRQGTTTLIVLSPGCQPCQDLAQRLATEPKLADPSLLVITTGSVGDPSTDALVARIPADLRVAYVDPHLAEDIGINAFPTIVVVRDGVVTAAGHNPESAWPAASQLSGGKVRR
jgi:hypothetical protein